MDHCVVADEADLRTAADDAFGDAAAGDLSVLRDREDLEDRRVAEEGLPEFWLQHAGEHGLHVVDEVVDDGVITQFDLGAFGLVAGVGVRPNVEADDRRAGCGGEDDVRFRYAADAGVKDAHAHFICRQFVEAADDRLDRALHVALNDERQFLDLGVLQLRHHLFERGAR